MASIPGSVRVGGFIAPSDTTDTYATHDSLYGRGGLKEVSSTEERDAIPADRRREGMIVYVGGVVQSNYQLIGGIDNANWAALETGGGGGVTDHGALTGLGDDDHTQYLNETRHDLLDHAGLTGIPSITGLLDETAHDLLDHTGLTGIPAAYSLPTASTTVLGGVKIDGTSITITEGVISSTATGGVTDHGNLSGLLDDDHTQYLNETRHDVLDHTGLTGIPIQYTDEMAQDAIGTLITNGTQSGITVSYDDANNKLDFTVTASSGVTYENLNANGDVGTGSDQVAAGNHTHTGVYEPADATILKDADIGVTVQAYAADLTSWAAIAPSAKQDTLISGTNIKTINNTSILGSGNIVIEGGSGMTNPMTASGDIIVGGTSGTPTRLAIDAAGRVDWTSPVAVTDTANLAFGKHHIVAVTSADKTLTLPEITSNDYGKIIVVEIAASTTKLITIDGFSTQTIDGATTRIMWAKEVAQLVATASGWTKVGGKSIPMQAGLYLVAGQLVANQVSTAINVNTALVTPSLASMHDTANSRIYVLRGGTHYIRVSMAWAGSNTTNTQTAQWAQVNGTTGLPSTASYQMASRGFTFTNHVTYDLAAGDYLKPYIYFSDGVYNPYTIYGNINSHLYILEVPKW